MDPKQVLELCRAEKVDVIDLRFMDFPGLWQHFSIPATHLKEETFEDGLPFDGSSIRGWKAINESDMLVLPEAGTAFIDPFAKAKTLVMICNILDPITREDYTRDPRNVAKKTERYLRSTGLGDTAFLGPECEFFIFDDVRYEQTAYSSFHRIDSIEGWWNSAREEAPNRGYKLRPKEGYFPVPPADTLQDIRSEMMLTMIRCGIEIECHHHEVATAGQTEIDMRYDSLTRMADKVCIYKYVAKNVAWRNDKTVTFMPKPLFGDNGTGMHCHLSIWKDAGNTFAGDGYCGLSQAGLYAIGGILRHAPALLAITNPTTNSYKRLVPGYEAPVNLAYSARNRSASVRIPSQGNAPGAKRLEFRCPDPSANPYLAFSAITMAAIDGIQNKIDPGEPFDKDIYSLPPEELKDIPSTPGSLEAALDALEHDHQFLLQGDVFTSDVIETWIEYKRSREVDAIRTRPHPYEFMLYFDA